MRLEDAAKILDATEYPRQMHRFLFDLMRKLQLCFTFPDDDAHYLIPDLLDKQEPAEAETIKPTESLNFEFRYAVLPEGTLPRFITRTHVLGTTRPRWRTGAILEFEGNTALVKADVQDKRVYIRIKGPIAGRRRLLAIIRSDLEKIHSELNKLRPEAFVPVPGHPSAAVSYERLWTLEKHGYSKHLEVIGDTILELDVQSLLNGVDLEGTRASRDFDDRTVRVFCSYSHKDESLREQLDTHLKLLQRQNIISVWNDRRIDPGDDWKKEIDTNLERADLILLLVSAHFLNSDYCYELEMKRALERHDNNEAVILPIIIRDVAWQNAPFAKIQALPTRRKSGDEA